MNANKPTVTYSDKPLVLIMLGSLSNAKKMIPAENALAELGVPFTTRALSAHRTPEEALQTAYKAVDAGVLVIIVAAGMAAHLGGFIAAHVPMRPVIAVPIADGALDGLDALLSTVQMPPGIPVATMPIDGAENAAIFAAQVLGTSDEREAIETAVIHRRNTLAEKVRRANDELQRLGSLQAYLDAQPTKK